jgi:alkylation response protein AidB-like acyl-CoA dehydrogenase
MDFALSDEHRMLKDLVARFVREELLPFEGVVLEREASGQGATLTAEERAPIDKKSRELGLWPRCSRRRRRLGLACRGNDRN